MRFILITSKLNFETAGGSVIDFHLRAKGLIDLGHDVTVITAFSYANKITTPLPYKVQEEMVMSRGLLGIQKHAYLIFKKYEKEADVFYFDGQIFLYGAGFYRLLGGKVPVAGFFNVRLNCWSDTQNNIAKVSVAKKIKKRVRLWIEKYIGVPIAHRIDRYMFNTPMLEEIYLNWGFKKEKSLIIEDCINMKEIVLKNMVSIRKIEAHQNNPNKITLFTTGRMIPEKGFDLVVKAFELIKNKERFNVVMSGGGPDIDRIKALVSEKKLDNYFTFPGWVSKEELTKLFKQAHIFIFPKWWIEYGSALLTEAMAFGLPCIVPLGGALEWLTERKQLYFTPDSYQEMADCIEKLGSDQNLRITFAFNSLLRTNTLDCTIIVKKLESVLLSLS
ncbi:MAG: glycosyltransferase [Candidatus Taylorbacteria bacterium]|nr:glycosyltransferase [Candidatus Taylorbacteria bacterium]